MALLFAVSAWTSGGTTSQDPARSAKILSAAGWRVVVVTAGMPLAAAWQQLRQPTGRLRLMDSADRLLGAR
jgi:hypothetical protein